MAEADVRTVRSFCRICTAVCGILVDVEGDTVVRVRGDKDHPMSHGYTCSEGARAAGDPSPSRSHRTADDAGRRRVATDDLGGVPRRPRRPPPGHHRPARPRIGRRLLRQRPRHGRRRLQDGRGPARRHRHSGQVQPADDRRHGEDARLPSGRRVPGVHQPHRLRAGEPGAVHRRQPGGLPRAQHRPVRPGVAPSGPCGSTPRSGSSIPPDRDGPAGHRTPGAPARHRLRRPRLRGPRAAEDGADREVLEHRCVGGADLAAAVEPFDRRHAADLAGLPEGRPGRAPRRGPTGRAGRHPHRDGRHHARPPAT